MKRLLPIYVHPKIDNGVTILVWVYVLLSVKNQLFLKHLHPKILLMLSSWQEHFGTLRDEFSSEVELLAKIEHRSLVRLLGYSEKGNERIIITEYVPNGTLREHLDGKMLTVV